MDNNFEVALTKCFFCGGDNQIIMNRVLKPNIAKKVKEAHGKVINLEPCPKCAEYMKQGIILISVRDGETDKKDPFRTGGFAVIKDEGLKKVMPPDLFEKVSKTRCCFIEDSVWNKLGLTPINKENKNDRTNNENKIE